MWPDGHSEIGGADFDQWKTIGEALNFDFRLAWGNKMKYVRVVIKLLHNNTSIMSSAFLLLLNIKI